MKASEMRDLSQKELLIRLNEEQESLQKLRFKQAIAGQIESPAKIKTQRRKIALLKSTLSAKRNQK